MIRHFDGKFTIKAAAYNDDGTPFTRKKRFFHRWVSKGVAEILLNKLRSEGWDVRVDLEHARTLQPLED